MKNAHELTDREFDEIMQTGTDQLLRALGRAADSEKPELSGQAGFKVFLRAVKAGEESTEEKGIGQDYLARIKQAAYGLLCESGKDDDLKEQLNKAFGFKDWKGFATALAAFVVAELAIPWYAAIIGVILIVKLLLIPGADALCAALKAPIPAGA
ncbi:MAG TPA: hypothetical protein VK463_12865 [Desulfomonilaceae bacterium]|nr:hypothetical protein [Desulfomonilaceae bacterium]